ncbi:MAG: hypothetical protein KY476_06725 [Planctomycetes bacterium]|nr:hypothetical protein [Planctomycetota bacterium]
MSSPPVTPRKNKPVHPAAFLGIFVAVCALAVGAAMLFKREPGWVAKARPDPPQEPTELEAGDAVVLGWEIVKRYLPGKELQFPAIDEGDAYQATSLAERHYRVAGTVEIEGPDAPPATQAWTVEFRVETDDQLQPVYVEIGGSVLLDERERSNGRAIH